MGVWMRTLRRRVEVDEGSRVGLLCYPEPVQGMSHHHKDM